MISDILLLILAIFIPPIPVLIRVGCAGHFWLNVILTLLAWIPGVIHAWWVILSHPEEVVYEERTHIIVA